MVTFLVIVLYLFVVLFDFLPMIKNGKKKECWVYSVLLFISFCVILLFSLDIAVPSPMIFIKQVVGIFMKT